MRALIPTDFKVSITFAAVSSGAEVTKMIRRLGQHAHCSLSNAHCSVLSLCLKHQHHLESRNLHQRYLFRINHLLRQQQLQHLLQQQLALQHQPPAKAHLKHLLKSISQHM